MKRILRLLLALSLVFPLFAQDGASGGGGVRSSDIAPEEEDDTLLVHDDGSGLDTPCTYRSGGPLVIHFPIRRHVGAVGADGRLKDPEALIAAGVLSPTATLRMPVYDVDTAGNPENPSIPPEVDVISVNGKRVGVLSGVTDEWKLNQFTIDIRELKFPAIGGGPADNVIEIAIDTENEVHDREAWCTAVDWVELKFGAVAPVFLVHGLFGGQGTWVPSFTSHLQASGIPYEVILVDPVGATEWNGVFLGRELHRNAAVFGAKKCHIIAHSKGGLDTRSYLNRAYDPERLKVVSVYTLSTPHRGTPVADLGLLIAAVVPGGSQVLKLLNVIAPAFADLTTPKVALFNLFNARIPPGTAFYSLGADADFRPNRVIDTGEAAGLMPSPVATLLYNFVGHGERAIVDVAWPIAWGERIINGASIVELGPFVRNDVLVSEVSAQRGQYLGTVPANHSTVKQATAAIVVDGIKNGAPVGARVLAESEPPDGVTTTALIRDSFRLTSSSRTRSYNVTLDSTPSASFFILAASRTLTVTVTAPGGATYSGEMVPLENEGAVGAAYVANVANPVPGAWTVTVAEAGPVTSLNVISTVLLSNEVQSMLTGAGDEPVPLGAKARFAFVVFDGTRRLTGLTIAALLLDPDDPAFAPATVTFRDDGTDADTLAGDGIYQAFVTPPAPGDYAVRVEALGTASTGAFRRSSAAELRVVRREARITGVEDFGVDDDFDDLDDRVVLRVYADLEKAGTYEVFARLRASNGRDVQRTYEATFPAGSMSADVPFTAAELIEGLAVDGPYTIVEVRVSRIENEDVVPADVRYYLGATHAWDLDELQHRRIRLSGNAVARGINTGGDARYEFLEVEVGVTTEVAGRYSWSVTLRDPAGREISFITGVANYDVGSYLLRMRFPGEDISRRRLDGPWVVTNFAIYGAGQSLVANDVFTTPPFKASQFGDPPRRRRARH